MPAEGTIAGEAVLQDIAPLMPPLAIGAQCRQGHPQVTGRQDTELLAQPAA